MLTNSNVTGTPFLTVMSLGLNSNVDAEIRITCSSFGTSCAADRTTVCCSRRPAEATNSEWVMIFFMAITPSRPEIPRFRIAPEGLPLQYFETQDLCKARRDSRVFETFSAGSLPPEGPTLRTSLHGGRCVLSCGGAPGECVRIEQ